VSNPHVFISYARKDKRFINRLTKNLRDHGINFWIDVTDLKTGVRDWEEEIRAAIEKACAILLVASPSSRKSPNVSGELGLGKKHKLPVIAIWADGEYWEDCIELAFTRIQYADARGKRYKKGILDTINALHHIMAITPTGTNESPVSSHDQSSPTLQHSPAVGLAQGYYYGLIRHIRETLGRINNGVWQHTLLISIGNDENGRDHFEQFPDDLRMQIKYRVIIPTKLQYTTQAMANKVFNYKDCVKGQIILKRASAIGVVESRPYGITFHRFDENLLEIVDVPTPMNLLSESISLQMRIKKLIPNSGDPDWQHHEDEEINRFQNELEKLLREYAALEDAQGNGLEFRDRIEIVRFNPDDIEEVKKNNLFWLLDAFDT
jgi:TIR domain